MKFVSMLFVLPALFFACRDHDLFAAPTPCEGRVDSDVDSGVDSGVDTAVDTGADTAVDTGTDTAVDTGTDTATDRRITGITRNR